METLLENIGFTKGEVKVYLALLEIGNTSSGHLILKADVARSKVYEILEKLKEKGLVSESVKNNTKYFQAASPERIIDYIRTKEKKLKTQEEEFKKILPQLLLRQNFAEEKQEVKVYVGFEGIKTYYNEVTSQLTEDDEYLAMTFSDPSLGNKSISLLFQKFHQRRAEKKAKAKILCNINDKITQERMNYSETPLYEFRVTDQILPTGVAIVKDMVATFNWGRTPRVFVIICKENAEQYKKFFYSIWEKAQKVK